MLKPVAAFARFQYNKTFQFYCRPLVLTEKRHRFLEIAAFELEGSTERG
jgi:hypothetical protein